MNFGTFVFTLLYFILLVDTVYINEEMVIPHIIVLVLCVYGALFTDEVFQK